MASGGRRAKKKHDYFDSSREETPPADDGVSNLLARYKEESRLLESSLQRLRAKASRIEDPTSSTNELILEQYQRFEEDMQAELTESKERAEALEQRCQQLEDELMRQAERAELEKLRAMEAVRSKCEERESVLVQQLRELQLQLQQQRSHPIRLQSRVVSKATAVGKDNPEGCSSGDKLNSITASTHSKAADSPNEVPEEGKQPSAAAAEPTKVKESDSAFILAQQLPPLPKFSGEGQEENFPE